MDEDDEMLYREMDEEDPWYMGDEPESDDDDDGETVSGCGYRGDQIPFRPDGDYSFLDKDEKGPSNIFIWILIILLIIFTLTLFL